MFLPSSLPRVNPTLSGNGRLPSPIVAPVVLSLRPLLQRCSTPNEEGQTPFALASRGGHLAVTRLIRQYAPEAGTPSGGDAQFQAHRIGSTGGEPAAADALPRPHGSTSNGYVGLASHTLAFFRSLPHGKPTNKSWQMSLATQYVWFSRNIGPCAELQYTAAAFGLVNSHTPSIP